MAIVSRIGEISESDKTVEPLQLPLADPRGAEIETKYLSVFSSADERHEAGFWQTEVGKSRWEFDDGGEIIYVLGGAMTVERDGHPSIEVIAPRSAVPGASGVVSVRSSAAAVGAPAVPFAAPPSVREGLPLTQPEPH